MLIAKVTEHVPTANARARITVLKRKRKLIPPP